MEAYIPALGMSLAAAKAHGVGRCPASKIRGVPASLVHRFAPLTEWHATGTHENRTAFYDPQRVRAIFGLETHVDAAANPEAIAALALWKANRTHAEIHIDCIVEWLTWSGSMARPVCQAHTAEGCQVVVKGRTATVAFPDGSVMKKRVGTRGFRFRVA